ncbi:MAG: hypothetical protein J6S40_07390, partial [Thermoguttaceae bacterium]|nr:hypothetical protein [Thermoguttaceae bacterium]
KIIDYLHAGRPVLAVGPKEMNSVAYFDRHQCGLTAETVDEAADALRRLEDEPDLVRRLADRAWQTGRELHDIGAAHARLAARLTALAETNRPADLKQPK